MEKISVGGFVMKGKKILLVQRAQEPGKGKWTIPGDFVEQTETINRVIQREIKEKTGINAQVQKIFSIGELPSVKEHDVYIVFRLTYLSGKIQLQKDEIMAADFFSIEDALKLPLANLTQQLLALFQEKSGGLVARNNIPEDANGFYLYG
ncbi:NUDIX hydrolase [Limosilactobacillus agrestimuris]|uniref:NUDIX hydrolase n=1 Tax=Limosilactobacillus agrestimuris TaxID=2941331 RepID=UPI0024079B3B|nr:NUDIX hydrolase [Limosilactobacillus agrestimuris]